MNIEALRKAKKMTQFDLALAVEVSPNTIRSWEAGVTKPTDENYQKLLKALEILPFTEIVK